MQQLQKTISYLSSKSPFYQQWFQTQKVLPLQILEVAHLSQLATVSKKDFAENNFDFLCCERQQIADYCTTSGTTGAPVTIALTPNDLLRLAHNEAHTFQLAQLSNSDICMLMLTLDRQFMAGIAYYEGLRLLGIPAVRSGSISPAAQLKNILQFKPSVLVAVPSFILKVISTAKEEGIDLATLSVKKIICIGEPIRTQNLEPNNLALQIAKQWNVQLFSTYASSEMQTAFSECTHGKGNHVNPQLIIAEVLDEQGNEVPNGSIGELTITTLGVEAMPLLRYRTGDMVFAIRETCACGSNAMRISPVLGRKNELLKYKGTSIFPAAIFNVLQSESAIQDYLIEAKNNEGRTDELLVHIVCAEANEQFKLHLENQCKAALRVTPEFQFSTAEKLAALRPAENRKIIRFIER
ncbi:MAG: AMP-binding protein [Chitinophagales bacterium]|nr:AMP-binding protein [Chitinophagales bacterium]